MTRLRIFEIFIKSLSLNIAKRNNYELIAKQIAKRFASKPEKEIKHLQKLNPDKLLELGEKIFDFESLREIHEWIKRTSSSLIVCASPSFGSSTQTIKDDDRWKRQNKT